jgi:hypothetical protein
MMSRGSQETNIICDMLYPPPFKRHMFPSILSRP